MKYLHDYGALAVQLPVLSKQAIWGLHSQHGPQKWASRPSQGPCPSSQSSGIPIPRTNERLTAAQRQERKHVQDRSAQLSWIGFGFCIDPSSFAHIATYFRCNPTASATTSNQGRWSLVPFDYPAKGRNRALGVTMRYWTLAASLSRSRCLRLGTLRNPRLRPYRKSWSTSWRA